MYNCFNNILQYFEFVLHPSGSKANFVRRNTKVTKQQHSSQSTSPESYNIRGKILKNDKHRLNPAP